jgi:ribonuclease BN (tRNA processing enzyme)
MKLRVLGAYGGEGPDGKHASAFLINERILLDAGCVTGALTTAEQMAVEHVLVSHPHLDHVAGLGYLAETRAISQVTGVLTVAAVKPVAQAMRTGFFNHVVWPDFTSIPSADEPVVRFKVLTEQAEQEVGGLHVTPVRVDHSVATTGFVVREGKGGLVYSADTSPTETLWRVARGHPEIRAVILECSYPNRLGFLASEAGHLTPSLVERELSKLPPAVPVMIFHIKPVFYEETAEELRRIGSDRIVLLKQGKTYNL